MEPKCPFCFSGNYSSSYLPDTFFNKKTFRYISCQACHLIYLNPFPQADDYEAMYPPSYQNGVNRAIMPDDQKLNGLRFPYGKHFQLIKKYAPGKNVLDYGCGQANFIFNALAKNLSCDGVEYNPKHIEVLKKELPQSHFFLIDDFLAKPGPAYDVIRLSNVLEHLDSPQEIMKRLMEKLAPEGVLLVEGPIETNASLAQAFRKCYFTLSKTIRKNKKASHPPTHIFFSNARNQRDFFTALGLEELYFKAIECEWPFPESISEVNSPGMALKWLIAKLSKGISTVIPGLGNTFIYVGRIKKPGV